MAFDVKNKGAKVQVSLNSFSSVVDSVMDAGSALVGHVADLGKSAVHHAKSATKHANKDLKYNMQNKTGRAIDN